MTTVERIDARYRVRPHQDSDFEAESRISALVAPGQSMSAEELRHWDRLTVDPPFFKHYVTVEERSSGSVVATAALGHAAFAFDPDRYWVDVVVDPSHQHRGLGRGLWEEMLHVAGERRAQGLWAAVRLDLPRSVTFFERAGFVEQRRTWVSRLDLSSLPTPPATPSEPPSASPEIRYTTLAEEGPDRPEVRQRYYRLHRDSGQDVPRMGPKTPFTYAQFEEIAFAGPGYLPDGVFLAQAGDEYVSVTALARLPLEPDTLHIEFTGTLRGYRGRGIASELKRRSIAFARSRGYRYLKTGNDSTNAPIWAINQKLGFRKEHVWLMGERPMEPSSPPAPSTGR